MKSLFVLLSFFLSSLAFSNERIFDCSVQKVHTIKELPEDFEVTTNSKVIFRQTKKDWYLQFGQFAIRDNDGMGPSVTYASEVSPDLKEVSYFFQLDGSLEFQLAIDTLDRSATLLWWGLGEPTAMANLQCEVIEQ